MKNGIISFALAAIAVLAMSSCKIVAREDQGDFKEKIYNVGQFSSIENNSFVDVEYIPSDTFDVKLSAPEKIIEHIKISVKNGTLTINQDDNDNSSRTISIDKHDGNIAKMKLYVKAPTLRSVSLTGSGDFAVRQTFNTKDLSISTTGSGDIAIIDLQCSGKLKLESQGSGDIAINKAKATNAGLETEGSGDFALRNFEAEKIDISSSGSGDIVLNCSNCGAISGSTSGSGDVVVHGSAKSCNISSSGSGEVVSAIN